MQDLNCSNKVKKQSPRPRADVAVVRGWQDHHDPTGGNWLSENIKCHNVHEVQQLDNLQQVIVFLDVSGWPESSDVKSSKTFSILDAFFFDLRRPDEANVATMYFNFNSLFCGSAAAT